MVRTKSAGSGLNPCPTDCVSDALPTEPLRQSHTVIPIYIYILGVTILYAVNSYYNTITIHAITILLQLLKR